MAVEVHPGAARVGDAAALPSARAPEHGSMARIPYFVASASTPFIVALSRQHGPHPVELTRPAQNAAELCCKPVYKAQISADCRPPLVYGAANIPADLSLKRYAPITFAPHPAGIAITHAFWNAVEVILVAELGPRIRIRAARPARNARRGFRRVALNRSARHAAATRSSGANRPWPCRRPSAITSAAPLSKHQR